MSITSIRVLNVLYCPCLFSIHEKCSRSKAISAENIYRSTLTLLLLCSIIEIHDTYPVVKEDLCIDGGIKLLKTSSKTLRDVETTVPSNKNKCGTLSR